MQYIIRQATIEDKKGIYNLYLKVANVVGGIARKKHELSLEYIENKLILSLNSGVCFVVLDNGVIIAEIHSHKLNIDVFDHIVSELTIVVAPKYQRRGIGKKLFKTFLTHIENYRKDILRVELIVRESNSKAINLYTKLGFKKEGELSKRIFNGTEFESDIPMAWFNPNFKKE